MAEMSEQEANKEKVEVQRRIARLNLGNETLTNLAATYYINENGDYGESINSAVESYAYEPSLQTGPTYVDPETGKTVKVVDSLRIRSRQGGKRYTGNFSEYDVIEDCAKIFEMALAEAKIGDILDLMGSKVEKGKYSEKYISELTGSGNEEDQKMGQMVMGYYIKFIQDKVAGSALINRANGVKGGLEGILSEDKELNEPYLRAA